MNDPSANDSLLRALAYLHPAWMVAGMALLLTALRSGLGIRRERRRPSGISFAALRGGHLRWAKLALVWLLLGFVGGPISMAWLRGRDLFETAHGAVALVALALFVATGVLGFRLERGAPASRETHAGVAVLAVLAAGLCAITGFVLLP